MTRAGSTELVERGVIHIAGGTPRATGSAFPSGRRARRWAPRHPGLSEPGYSEDDQDFLVFVGQHIATALTRASAIEETRERNAELAVINEIGDALARQLDFQAVIDMVGDKVREIFDVDTMASCCTTSRPGQ